MVRGFRRAVRRRRQWQWSLGVAAIAVVVLVYWVLTLTSDNPALLPPPGEILQGFVDGVRDGSLVDATLASLRRVAIGYGIGCAVAVVVGSLRGWFRFVGYILDPIVDALRPVPALAYIPLVILWFGIGESARILVIGVASFLSCIVSVTAGMRRVPPVYVDAARTMGARRTRIFLTIALPSSVPFIFAGLRVALGAAWGTLVAAELIAAQTGLGYLLQAGQEFFHTEIVIVALIVIGVIGFLMDALLQAVESWLLRWSPETRR
ncbi:ABC transporter permease [Nakamurella endophytica]|uniref:ABC transporter permease n=1 Tax=Nakamurella endophytica TaxID=1748367 RepID=A0A917TB53_9ACTN|nr:ABC transporter permease [Nakamurella endophytica]GGM16674.1 ABC transporter permease [Nakamurella endophytica]